MGRDAQLVLCAVVVTLCTATAETMWQAARLKPSNALIYAVQTSTFADSNGDGVGDLRGIIQKLRYLRDAMGVDYILLPAMQANIIPHREPNHNAYPLYIASSHGTTEDVKALIAAAKTYGIGILFTWLAGAASPYSPFVRRCIQREEGFTDAVYIAEAQDAAAYNVSASWLLHPTQPDIAYLRAKGTVDAVALNMNSTAVLSSVGEYLYYWHITIGVAGFLLKGLSRAWANAATNDDPHTTHAKEIFFQHAQKVDEVGRRGLVLIADDDDYAASTAGDTARCSASWNPSAFASANKGIFAFTPNTYSDEHALLKTYATLTATPPIMSIGGTRNKRLAFTMGTSTAPRAMMCVHGLSGGPMLVYAGDELGAATSVWGNAAVNGKHDFLYPWDVDELNYGWPTARVRVSPAPPATMMTSDPPWVDETSVFRRLRRFAGLDASAGTNYRPYNDSHGEPSLLLAERTGVAVLMNTGGFDLVLASESVNEIGHLCLWTNGSLLKEMGRVIFRRFDFIVCGLPKGN